MYPTPHNAITDFIEQLGVWIDEFLLLGGNWITC